MNHLKKTQGRVLVVAFVAAAGLFASAAPGLAAEQSDPVAPLAASAPTAQPAPTDDGPDDEPSGDDPDDASTGGGWSDRNTNATADGPDESDGESPAENSDAEGSSDAGREYSDSDEDSDEDSTPDHFGNSKQTKAEKAAAARAAKKAKALQQKANKKDKAAKKSSAAKKKAKAAAAKKMKKAAMRAAKRAAAQRAAEQRSAQQQRRAIAEDDSDSPRSGGSADSMRDAILDLTNRARKSAGCGSVRYSTQLEKSAQWMANDMSEHHYMSHNDRQGRNSDKRIRGTGFNGDKTGENLGEGFDSPEAVFKAWMGSPSHRRNILDCGFRILGVGFASSGGYWVQHFGG